MTMDIHQVLKSLLPNPQNISVPSTDVWLQDLADKTIRQDIWESSRFSDRASNDLIQFYELSELLPTVLTPAMSTQLALILELPVHQIVTYFGACYYGAALAKHATDGKIKELAQEFGWDAIRFGVSHKQEVPDYGFDTNDLIFKGEEMLGSWLEALPSVLRKHLYVARPDLHDYALVDLTAPHIAKNTGDILLDMGGLTAGSEIQ